MVAWWRVVGPGFGWLSGATALLFAVPAALAGGEPLAWAGAALALAGTLAARAHRVAAAWFGASAITLGVAAALSGDVALVVTGALALGGITSEMLLGHWYLVDPRLPRWALERLDVAAGVGLLLDVAVLLALGVLGWPAGDAVIGWAFVALAVMSLVLVVAVWFALREPRYSGVMAATGLSYLAVLTVFGATVTGRILL